ncbi:MAG: amino acid adenylation domain-containing protein [Candidatus Aminicenantes bacterium]|nr:amino acid adenylation domain-containing protein [Candidatus Aminicenantes bacterium]
MKNLNPKRIANILALTPVQEGMLFHYLQDPQGELYFEQLSLEIPGEINVQHFKKAWNVVIETNEMLRTVFRWEKLEKPSQIILKKQPFEISFHDLSDMDIDRKKAALAEIKTKDRNEGFDLTRVPFRVILCKQDEAQYEMVISNHHILYDGWSNGIILREFFKAYHTLLKKEQSFKLPAKTSFKEYIKWFQSRDRKAQEQFWRDYLSDFETLAELPIKRRIEETTKVDDCSIILEEDLKTKLDAFVKDNRVTLATVFYTAWGILLQKYCGSEDVIFGTTVSGRSADIKGIEDMVGLFINTIPLRIQSTPGAKIIDVIPGIENLLRKREEFENTPLVDIQSYSSLGGGGSLFDTIVAIENYPLDDVVCRDVARNVSTVQSYSMIESTHYDLTVGIMLFNEIKIKFSFKPGLFDKETIENLAGHFKGIIQIIIENPETKLSQLEIMSIEEKNRVLYDFNNTAAEYPADKTIHQLFAEQVEKSPDRIAVIGSTAVETLRATSLQIQITYRQLNEQSGRLAGLLLEKGVLPDSIVAIMMARSIEMVIGIFGILKSGGAYLPIDPEYPEERKQYMLKDSGAKLLAVANELEGKKVRRWEGEKVVLESILYDSNHLKGRPRRGLHHSSFIIHHSNLAYIIYTSGSTGKPKGVMIEQRSAVNLLYALQRQYPFTGSDVYLLKTSYTFDVSVTELFGWTMGGGRLAILEKNGEKDPLVISGWIQWHHVTHINFVPSMFNAFANQLDSKNINRLSGLKYIFLAGEALLPEFVKKFHGLDATIRLENIYGPTESTVYSSKYSLAGWSGSGNIPIGRPMPNIRLYIFDKYNRLQPPGIAGELTIAGVGVARGYLNRPELTAEKFTSFPHFLTSSLPRFPLYRTGDLARWLSDGNIEFLGRIDHQVKIRGYRVELGEIENLLLKQDRVKDTVVVLKEDETGDKNLAAYFVSDIGLSDTELREYLLKDLPEYMIPAYFVRLDKIPLTPSGKVDRRALPGPKVKETAAYVAPRDEIEMKLVEIWAGILGRDITLNRVGIDDNFFRLGGHSLKATSLASRIHKVFNVKIPLAEIFKYPTIRGLFGYITEALGEQYVSIEPVEEREYYLLSSAQKRLYFLQQMEAAGTAYNISAAWVLEGIIDKPLLEQVIAKLIQRHESLRTSFIIIGEEPVQRIHSQLEFEIDKSCAELFQKRLPEGGNLKEFIRPFDLSQAPLLRVGLIEIEKDRHIFLVDMHHIISDGMSIEILVGEFSALLTGLELPAIGFRYKDFAAWQCGDKKSKNSREQENYWLKEFADDIPVLDLPTDFGRPLIQRFAGDYINFELSREITGSIKALSLETGTTLYMVLLALYTIFLAKISSREDIVIGTPVAGRRHIDLEKIIGMFVNTLALRNYPLGEKKFTDFLGEIKERTLKGFENQEYQYEDLVEQIAVNRDAGRNPLFDTMFTLQNTTAREIVIPGLKLTPYRQENNTSKFDFSLIAVEVEEELQLAFEYCTKLFKRETIERFIVYFINIIRGVVENRQQRISDFEIITEEEKKRILFDFNDTETAYPKDKTIHQLFEEQAEKAPDRIALSGEPVNLTYRQLNIQSNRLAGLLIEKGVQADNIVGIMMERSIEMIIGIIGILKSGGAYLSIDPDYPQKRIDYMLKDSAAKILLTATQCVFNFHHSSFIIHHSIHSTSNLAYLIYTSGSTGEPKGVMVIHRNVVRLVKNTNYVEFAPGDSILQTGAMEFDASTFEIWGALLNGLKLHLVNKETILTPGKLKVSIREYDISTMWMTSPLFNQMLLEDIEIFAGLKNLLVGGDVLYPPHISLLRGRYPQLKIINGYGPTENTTFSTTFLVHREYTGNIPIGKPIANSTAYIVDKYIRLQPVGVPGELVVGGDGIAGGYLNDPELTAEKFGPQITLITQINKSFGKSRNPFSKGFLAAGGILYKTGDTARWLPDGNIEFLGRIDQQVKIRGFRVELGEIENRLLKHKDIKESVVIAKAESGTEKVHIGAYIVSDREIETQELREYLAGQLPGYMIPSYFVRLDKVPLTSTGKIDRKTLPVPLFAPGKESGRPRNEIEKKLVGLWSEILGRDALHASQLQTSIGISDNFFQVGGHSLKATSLVARIHKIFNVKIPLAEIFKRPTIGRLAEYIKGMIRDLHIPIEPAEEKEYYPLSPAQKRLYILHQLVAGNTSYNMPYLISPAGNTGKERLEAVLKTLIARHESLRTSFETINQEPVQRIHKEVDFTIHHSNLSEVDTEQIIANFTIPFNLDRAPLLRAHLLTLEPEPSRQILFIDMHHIITDGTSQGILEKEFIALCTGEQLPTLPLQYKDYSEWYHGAARQEAVKQQESHWLKEFCDELPVLHLPTDYPRPIEQSIEGNAVIFSFNAREAGLLKAISQENETTLYMTLLALFSILLAKLSGQEDIIIGTPIAARRHADLQSIIGMFVNTLAMRNYPSGEKSFKNYLKEVKQRTLEAYENQEYPFEELVERVSVNRDTGRNPVFDVMFNMLNQGDDRGDKTQLIGLDSYEHRKRTSKFDMNWTAAEVGDEIRIDIEYCTKLFKPTSIDRFTGYFKNIAQPLAGETGLKIADIEILGEKEKEEILRLSWGVEWSNEEFETIHGLFAEQVERTPDHIALVGAPALSVGPVSLSYRQLNEQSDRLAELLIEKGVLADNIISIMMERCIEMIIGILGILKSGGAYLPIDPEYPQERIDYMLKDSGAQIIVGDRHACPTKLNCQLSIVNCELLMSVPRAPFHHSSFIAHHSNHLVYLIYTSGSTGKPKGVMLEHRNLVNLFKFQSKYTNLDCSRILQFTTISFDVSFQEIFSAFLSGGQLFLVNKETRTDIPELFKLIDKNRIKTVFLPISFLKVIFKEEEYIKQIPLCIRHIVTAGEQLVISNNFSRYLREREVYLHNHYGPSETHVVTTLTIDPGGDIPELPSIGKPIRNTGIYIMDKSNHLLPVGAAGELWIGGVQVGRGYLNRPELTAEKFIDFHHSSFDLPRIQHSNLYSTGDLARWLNDGNIEFLGRFDHQVKIRGFRVELGEIGARLVNHQDIKEAVVIPKTGKNGDRYLCAYIVSSREFTVSELRKYLVKYLPDYMIPSYFVQLEKIPLTPNGKIDRRALPETALNVGDNYTAPGNEIEKKLVGIWSEVLGRDESHASQLQTSIGINDNFFQLGGHSLKATILAAKIHKVLNIKIPLGEIFKRPSIRGLSDYINDATGAKYTRIEPLEKKEYYPLSSAQKRLYFLQVMEEVGTGYNLPHVMKLEGKIDAEKLEDTFVKLIQRHESFRTSFFMVEEEPVQRIHDHAPFEIEFSRGAPLWSPFIRPFDLSKAPLLRVALVKIEEEVFLLMVDMHHIISDGTSMGVLVKEFMTLYEGRTLNHPRLHYKDYAHWETHRQDEITQQEAYWLNEFDEFKDEVPVLDLPVDDVRPRVKSFAGSALSFDLDGNETRALNTLVLQRGGTLYMVLLAVYNIFLAKLGNQEVFIVGTPTAGRTHADLEQIIGMFVNTLVLKNAPAHEKSFHSFLEEVKENTINAFANQDYQYEDLVEKVMRRRDTGRNPLFDTMFILQNMDIPTMEIPGLKLGPCPYESNTAKFDLTLICTEIDEHISCTLEYSTRLFKKETIRRFINYYRNIIAAVLENPHIRIAEIDMLPEEEKRRLLMEFNDTAKEYPGNKTIYRLFEEQAEKVPDHAALVFKNKVVTYRHFNEWADRMANYLRKEKGLREGDRVVVLMDRSIQLIISLMGVMKSGGAYVPLDAKLPPERLRVVFNDASIGIAVSIQEYLETLTGLKSQCKTFHSILCMDVPNVATAIDNYPAAGPGAGDARNTAYVMYTSGSSGIPKGVLVEHRTIVNTLWWRKNFYGYNPDSVSLQNPPYFFDSSVTDIFTPLLGGARLVLIEEKERMDLAALKKIITIHKVTHFIAVPAFYHVLLEEIGAELACLKMICAAGEYFPDELVKKHFKKLPRVRITNEYGPTENSVNTTIYELTLDSPRAYIGKPIRNVAVYILDRNMRLCPMGVGGEICLSGSSVAVGYLNRPELTAEKFIDFYHSSFIIHHSNLYRTGDLGRWLPDGNLEFIGRLDSQVKIRGIRIETGEIENHLLRHNNIKEAVVLAREGASGEKFLCAYIVPAVDGNRKPGFGDDLKEYLSAKLPDYMIPSYFIIIDAIPLLTNGKINRDALPPLPSPGFSREGSQYSIAPRNESEEKLAGIWSEVLGIEKVQIGIDENFFELGGYSLRATIVVSRIHKIFNVNIPLAEIFKSPTIRGLAKYITGAGEQMYAAIEPAEKREYYPLSASQKRLYLLYRMDPDNVSYNMPQEIRFPGEINIEKLQKVFKVLINRHESLRTSFEMIDEEPVQRIHEDVEFKIDLLGGDSAWLPFIRPFDLAKAPLIRVGIIKEENGEQVLLVDLHHIITDGTSQVILHGEFEKLRREQGADLPALRLQYKDYSQWQNNEQQQALVKKKEPYWLREFGDELPVLNLPIDYARPFIQSSEGNTVAFTLTVEENRGLRRLARESNVTLFMVILAVFNVLLSKLSGQEDIIVGTPVMGRRHADLERIIGMFINTLPLRNKPYGGMKLKAFLNELKGRTLEAHENQEYPFEELVEKVSVKRDTGRNPIFDVMFNLLNREGYLGDMPVEAEMHEYKHKKGTSKFDLMLTAVDLGERLLLVFEYCSRLFEPVTIERFITYFKLLLYWLQASPDPGLSELEIITEEEKQKILYEFNDIKIAYPTDKTIHQLFAEQVEKSQDRVALVGAIAVQTLRATSLQIQLTYRQLNEQSNRLAGLLIEKSVRADSIVGIMMDRTIDLVIGILGILKAGGAYLPIDSGYPVERKRYMIEDGEVRHLLVSNYSGDIGPGIINQLEVLDLGQEEIYRKKNVNLDYLGSGSNLVYVIYTSGTTGKPKGVMLEHRTLVNLIHYQYEKTNIDFNRVLQFTTISFDVSAQEIFSTLLWGGQLYLVNNETRTDIPRLFKLIEKNRIKTVFLPISFLKVIFKEEEYINLIPRCIRHITTAGEQVVISHNFKNYLREEKVYLHNHYGPAEAHVVTTLTIDPGGDIAELPSIGKPVMNTAIHIVDKWGHLLPPGVAGEIRIGGVQVGRGYLNRPELTCKKFKIINYKLKIINGSGALRADLNAYGDEENFHHSSFIIQHSNLYSTGDLARWLPDGNIEFLGRMDQQVKIRGFRIELAEIENRLKEHPLIKEAVVIDRNDNERKYLCAYIVVGQTLEKGMAVQQLKEYLEAKLPAYMVPACFVEIDKIPLKANGKIDRDMLPGPMELDFHTGDAYRAPGTDIQRTIAAIWEEVLGREKIGIRDNFFDMGGNSLDFVRVSNKLKEKLGRDIPVVTLFTYPTISSLEHYLSSVELPVTASLIPVNFVLLNGSPQSQGNIFFIHEVLGDVGAYMKFCKQLGTHYNCWGVEAEKLRNYVPKNATIEEIAAKYISQMKEIQPQGPYLIATWSWGGHLGLEMALQLERIGETLSLLAFFDCLGPYYAEDRTPQEFTLETEKNFLRDFFISTGNEAELEKINDIEQLWPRAVEILSGNAALVEQLRQSMIENALALPDYDYLTGEELIQYLNLNRTHFNASARYIPAGKINTPIHYFAANQNTERVESWKDYCHNPVIYHEINGDHHSIFRNEKQIVEFARSFNEVLEC